MRLGLLRSIALVCLLLPGAWYAWQWREMPHASEYHDDGIYFVTAKSIAETGGFKIDSFPGRPSQTKYPPLWPAVLSLAWFAEPHYPDNLPYAMLLCWIWLPVSLAALYAWLQRAGIGPDMRLLVCAGWTLSPYVILFSTTMLSEMIFTALLLLALLALNREGAKWAVVAGVLASLAFLSRTAGIALLPAAAISYVLIKQPAGDRRWREFLAFCGVFLPVIVVWARWSAQNRAPGEDSITLYYTNYFGYYLRIFSWREAYLYVWKNLDGVFHGLGAFILPNTSLSVFEKVVALTIGIAGAAGVVKLSRKDWNSPLFTYTLFVLTYLGMLVFWHFPPNERFMLPIAHLWLLGFWTEMKHLAINVTKVFRRTETGQKVAGAIMASLVTAALAGCGWRQFDLLTNTLPEFYELHARRLADSEPAMQWVRDNLPSTAHFLAENDPLLYLRTGRRGAGMMLTTIHWYRDNHAARTADHANAPEHARSLGLQYFLLNDWDFARDMPADENKKLHENLRTHTRLIEVHRAGPTAIYRFR